MKKLNVCFLFVFLLVSCSPNVTTTPTSIPTQTFTKPPTLTATSTSIPTITPTPLPITFIYQDNVPADARELQERAAVKAYIYFSKYAELGQITIYTFSDIELILDDIYLDLQADYGQTKSFAREFWLTTGGYIAGNNVVINSGYFVWRSTAQWAPCYKVQTVAHEMFHLVQRALLHHALNQSINYGPEWLKEGSSEVMSMRSTKGLYGCNQLNISQWLTDAKGAAPLRAFEKEISTPKFWDISPLGVFYLLEIAPDDETSLIKYYSEIGDGKPWHEAFKIAFGLSVDDFYTKFEEYRDQ